MKKFIFLMSLLFASAGFAQQLHNYDQIKSAVTEGKRIRIFIDYTKCTSSSPSLSQKIIGNNDAIYTPNAMAITTAGDIISYILYFTLHDGRYPSRPVYQYGTYAISKNDALVLTFISLNAVDYSPLGDSVSLNCKIDDSVRVFVAQQDESLKSKLSNEINADHG